jgi:hypothetical protein
VTVGGRVHAKNRSKEVNVHACLETTQKPTSAITNMPLETVEGNLKCQDLEYIPNKQVLLVEGDDGSTPPKNWSIRVVSYANTEVAN